MLLAHAHCTRMHADLGWVKLRVINKRGVTKLALPFTTSLMYVSLWLLTACPGFGFGPTPGTKPLTLQIITHLNAFLSTVVYAQFLKSSKGLTTCGRDIEVLQILDIGL